MPKRSSKKQTDESRQPATSDCTDEAGKQQATDALSGKNPAAVALGRLGGKKGGAARAQKLTKEQRREIARKAAQARWARRKAADQGGC